MREDCLKTQEAISRAADGEKVEVHEAAQAKRHCAECSVCATYVRTLAAVKAVPAPNAPDTVVDRAVDAVLALAQADRKAAEKARDDAQAAQVTEEQAATVQEDTTVTPLRRRRMSPSAITAWVTGSAAVLIVAMVVTASGLRLIGGQDAAIKSAPTAEYSVNERTADAEMSEELSVQDQGSAISGFISLSTPRYVMLNDYAYAYLGTIDQNPQELPRFGTVRTSLDAASTPTQRAAYSEDDGRTILIEQNDGRTAKFTLVMREYNSGKYAMRASNIDSFEEWPVMPDLIPQPVNADGGPVFVEAGDDDGRTIYAPPGRDPSDGFAIAPSTPVSDPAAGNPEWTWWEPWHQ